MTDHECQDAVDQATETMLKPWATLPLGEAKLLSTVLHSPCADELVASLEDAVLRYP